MNTSKVEAKKKIRIISNTWIQNCFVCLFQRIKIIQIAAVDVVQNNLKVIVSRYFSER